MPACEQDLRCVDPGLGSGGVLVQAVETLRTFEKKDSRVKSAAATNLSFLFFLVSLQVNDLVVRPTAAGSRQRDRLKGLSF